MNGEHVETERAKVQEERQHEQFDAWRDTLDEVNRVQRIAGGVTKVKPAVVRRHR